ncbi:hypothetical protein BKA70DRAFT_1123320 [Coprinopsis sp. MPI-PUGE-AT-0042]|nr:hypothetical protein BKA70DRAFT_1123320 [Coprinopsis sp. MPI-PUGE-AT-0042]
MGVEGLWDVLRPAAKPRALTELAVSEGFQRNEQGLRGYRIGIDASIWFFHAKKGGKGENPALQTLFFRCAQLMKAPFLPLFVFDGPKRPDFKRDKRIDKAENILIPGMKRIAEAFGFEHRMAPGEAEAELAYLNTIGVIDGVLSDDVDTFLFGALTVIRNPSVNLAGNQRHKIYNMDGKLDRNHSWVFESKDFADLGLTRGGLILVGLLSGGDYHSGLDGCGIKISVALAQCGFGDSLYQAALNLEGANLDNFLEDWRYELKHELKTNSRGIIGKKFGALASSLPSSFPPVAVLQSYVKPVTSESASMGEPCKPQDIRWDKEPNISKIAETCELFFEWGYKEAILKRFRTIIWPGAALRIIRRAVILDDTEKPLGAYPPATPSSGRIRHEDACGTPSKMITKYFSSLTINDDSDDHSEQLITKIHSKRFHASTDGVLEYRLEIDPAQLIRLVEFGLRGTRQAAGPIEWASDEEEMGEGEGEGKGKKEPIDPLCCQRLWLPACMVEVVEPRLVRVFEDEARNQVKKAYKGKGQKKRVADDLETPGTWKGALKESSIAVVKKNHGASDSDILPTFTHPKSNSKAKPAASTSRLPIRDSDSNTASDTGIVMPPLANLDAPSSRPATSSSKPKPALDHPLDTPSPRRRFGIKDLTKNKKMKEGPVAFSSTNNSTSVLPVKKGAKADVFNSRAKATNMDATTNPSMSNMAPRSGVAPFPLALGAFRTDDMDVNDASPLPYQLPSPTTSGMGPPYYRKRTASPSSSATESRAHKSPRKSRASTPLSHRSQPASASPSKTPRSVGQSGFPVAVYTPRRSMTLEPLKLKAKATANWTAQPAIEISSDDDEDVGPTVVSLRPKLKRALAQPVIEISSDGEDISPPVNCPLSYVVQQQVAMDGLTPDVVSQSSTQKESAGSRIAEAETPPQASKKTGWPPVHSVIDLT